MQLHLPHYGRCVVTFELSISVVGIIWLIVLRVHCVHLLINESIIAAYNLIVVSRLNNSLHFGGANIFVQQ